jgi:hypothetical protein
VGGWVGVGVGVGGWVWVCTVKKKGILPNLKRFLTWAHHKILFWFRKTRGFEVNHSVKTKIKVPRKRFRTKPFPNK